MDHESEINIYTYIHDCSVFTVKIIQCAPFMKFLIKNDK